MSFVSNKWVFTHAAGIVLLTCAPAVAQEKPGIAFSLGNGLSTLGAAVEPELRLNESFGFRMPIGIGRQALNSDLDRPLTLGDDTEGGVGLIADYYPFGSGLRLGGGIVATGQGFSVPGDFNAIDPFDTNSSAYSSAATDGSDATQTSVRTVMSMGYTGTLSSVIFGVDLGVMVDPNRVGTPSDSASAALATDLGGADDNLPGNLEELGISPFFKIGAKLSF